MSGKNNNKTRRFYLSLIVIFLILLLFLLTPVLEPFYIAAFIAYLSSPLVERLVGVKIPRIISVIIVFLLILSLLTLLGLILIPMIIDQINLLIHKLPMILVWLQKTAIPWLSMRLGRVIEVNIQNIDLAIAEAIKNNQDIIAKIFSTLTSSGITLVSIVFQMLLIPVVTFYLLRDWNTLIHNCRRILPRTIEPTVVLLVSRYNEVLRSFIRGQLLVIFLLGLIYTAGLWILGLQFAVLIGIGAGLLNIVPYLGFTIGLLSGLLASYFQFNDFNHLFYVLLVFLIGLSIESMVLTPLLVGDSIGLHPVAVIFAVLTGAHFFGLLGALLALPVAAAIMVLLRYGLLKYYRSALYA